MLDSLSVIQNNIKLKHKSCYSVVNDLLSNIEKSASLNIYVEVYADEALEKAKELDLKLANGESVGQLFGCVVSIKDVICYKDHKVTAASKILEGFESTFSATAVQRLLDEDAIIIGRTNCDEFAMGSSNENSVYGPTLNGFDNTKVPGGSSGASAVSVQMNTCHIALGSDTGGSVRQPAAFCGVIGFKPSYGRISRYGLLAYASSFDQIGILSHHSCDIKSILEIVSGSDEFDATCSNESVNLDVSSNIKNKKIAYFSEVFEHEGFDPEIKAKTKDYLLVLRDKGMKVEEVSFDYLSYLIPTYYILTMAEASSNLSRYDGVRYGWRKEGTFESLNDMYIQTRSEGFSPVVKNRIMLGTFVLSSGFHDAYFTKAQKVRRLIKERVEEIFKDYDYIVMPTSPVFPWSLGEKSADPNEMYLADIFTVLANLAGVPAVSIPLSKEPAKPMGVQFFAPMNNEASIFSLLANLKV